MQPTEVQPAQVEVTPAPPAASDIASPVQEANAGTTEAPQPQKPQLLTFNNILELIFVVGFASIFLINALNAYYAPQDFVKLLGANPITRAIGHYDFMVKVTMVNDISLGVLLLSKWKKKFVWAWAGAWLVMVAGIKALYLTQVNNF